MLFISVCLEQFMVTPCYEEKKMQKPYDTREKNFKTF